RGFAGTAAGFLSSSEGITSGLDLCAIQSFRPLELINVGFRQRETRRPDKLLLVLNVPGVELDSFRGINFVLADQTVRHQFEYINPRGDRGAVDQTFVPVAQQITAADHTFGVDRSAIKKSDLLRMFYVAPIEYGQTALIKRLHHDIAARY